MILPMSSFRGSFLFVSAALLGWCGCQVDNVRPVAWGVDALCLVAGVARVRCGQGLCCTSFTPGGRKRCIWERGSAGVTNEYRRVWNHMWNESGNAVSYNIFTLPMSCLIFRLRLPPTLFALSWDMTSGLSAHHLAVATVAPISADQQAPQWPCPA